MTPSEFFKNYWVDASSLITIWLLSLWIFFAPDRYFLDSEAFVSARAVGVIPFEAALVAFPLLMIVFRLAIEVALLRKLSAANATDTRDISSLRRVLQNDHPLSFGLWFFVRYLLVPSALVVLTYKAMVIIPLGSTLLGVTIFASIVHIFPPNNGVLVHNVFASLLLGALIAGFASYYGEFRRPFQLEHADLRHLDLRGFDFRGANLYQADLNSADLTLGTDLEAADLREAILNNAKLAGARLVGTKLFKANLDRADLSRANLSNADLGQAKLIRTKLFRAVLKDANLVAAVLHKADLSETILTNAYARDADLTGAYLQLANLKNTILQRATLTNATLLVTILVNADLTGATLKNTDLRHAKLNNANLSKARLENVDLRYADLKRTIITDAILSFVDLSGAKNLTQEQLDAACGFNTRLPDELVIKSCRR